MNTGNSEITNYLEKYRFNSISFTPPPSKPLSYKLWLSLFNLAVTRSHRHNINLPLFTNIFKNKITFSRCRISSISYLTYIVIYLHEYEIKLNFKI